MATGTGKSYVMMRLLEEFEEEDGYVEQKHVSVSWLDLADIIQDR